MLHLRIVSPPHRTEAVVAVLRDDPATFNISLLAGAALEPEGDVVSCDIAREGANNVIAALRELGLHKDGSLSIEDVDVALGAVAMEAERRAPGYGSDAAVWEEVDARVWDDSVLSVSFVVFQVVAAMIAAIGLMEDAPILIVGAMAVGPEYGPVAGLSVGLFKWRWSRIRTASITLAVGLSVAAAMAFLATEVVDRLSLVPDDFEPHTQQLTGFVVEPSFGALAVAVLAGIAGMLSLTQAKAGAMVGVLISVTTTPAVAGIGVSAALSRWPDAWGATVNLAVNVAGLVLAGLATLWAQRELWQRFAPQPEPVTGGQLPSEP